MLTVPLLRFHRTIPTNDTASTDWPSTRTHTLVAVLAQRMSPTVHELRNTIRRRAGRFEREANAQFTKEELAAIVEALGGTVGDPLPSKGSMRANIREGAGIEPTEGTLRKADLETVAGALEER